MSGLTSAEHPMYTHRVVDDINFQVNNAFGWAGKIFIFQDVTLLFTITDLIPNMKVCFYLSERHSDKFRNAEKVSEGLETENLQNTSIK